MPPPTSEAGGTVTSPASTTGSSTASGEQMKLNFFNSLKQRGFDTICLLNANDTDIFDFIQSFPHGATGIQSLILRCCIGLKDTNSKEYNDSKMSNVDPEMDADPPVSIHPEYTDEEIESIGTPGENNIELIRQESREEGVGDPTSTTSIHPSVYTFFFF